MRQLANSTAADLGSLCAHAYTINTSTNAAAWPNHVTVRAEGPGAPGLTLLCGGPPQERTGHPTEFSDVDRG
jgi:hypothetical protein